jgi:hypothetical protein
VSAEHLHWFELEGNTFPERIVTSDKTWVYSCTPESEPSTMEWHYNGSPLPRKVKTQLSTGKIVAGVFWDSEGVIYDNFLIC